jgi:hypothetical protein
MAAMRGLAPELLVTAKTQRWVCRDAAVPGYARRSEPRRA